MQPNIDDIPMLDAQSYMGSEFDRELAKYKRQNPDVLHAWAIFNVLNDQGRINFRIKPNNIHKIKNKMRRLIDSWLLPDIAEDYIKIFEKLPPLPKDLKRYIQTFYTCKPPTIICECCKSSIYELHQTNVRKDMCKQCYDWWHDMEKYRQIMPEWPYGPSVPIENLPDGFLDHIEPL